MQNIRIRKHHFHPEVLAGAASVGKRVPARVSAPIKSQRERGFTSVVVDTRKMWLSILVVLIIGGAWAWKEGRVQQPRTATKKPGSLCPHARLLEESRALLAELKKLTATLQQSHPHSIRLLQEEVDVTGSTQ